MTWSTSFDFRLQRKLELCFVLNFSFWVNFGYFRYVFMREISSSFVPEHPCPKLDNHVAASFLVNFVKSGGFIVLQPATTENESENAPSLNFVPTSAELQRSERLLNLANSKVKGNIDK